MTTDRDARPTTASATDVTKPHHRTSDHHQDQQRRDLAAEVIARPVRPVVTTDAYLSLKALSTYAGLSVRRLRGYLTDRRSPLPCYRIGGKILVRRSDFDAWAAQFRRDVESVEAIVDEIVQGL